MPIHILGTIFHPSHNPQSRSAVLVAHGLVDDHTQAYNYLKQVILRPDGRKQDRYLHDLDKESLLTIRFDDAGTGIKKYFTASQSSLGQSHEIEQIKNGYDNYVSTLDSVIIHGISRGASAAINFVAKHNPENIKALILEAPFDSIEHIINDKISNKTAQYYIYKLIPTLFRRFKSDGEHPIEQIKNIKNKNLPILIICSEQDRIVPWQSPYRIYQELLENGFTNVFFLRTQMGKHAKILWGTEGENYQKSVQIFKQKYNL